MQQLAHTTTEVHMKNFEHSMQRVWAEGQCMLRCCLAEKARLSRDYSAQQEVVFMASFDGQASESTSIAAVLAFVH